MKNKDFRHYDDGFTDEELDTLINSNEILENIQPDFDVEKINSHKYRFTIKNLKYEVDIIESLHLSSNKKIVEIKFKLMNNPNAPKRDQFDTQQQYDIALKKSQIGITGTGSPQKVFGKVVGTIINSIKEIEPDYITFITDEKKKQRIYFKLLKLFDKYVSIKYKQIDTNPLTKEKTEPEEFWLEKV